MKQIILVIKLKKNKLLSNRNKLKKLVMTIRIKRKVKKLIIKNTLLLKMISKFNKFNKLQIKRYQIKNLKS